MGNQTRYKLFMISQILVEILLSPKFVFKNLLLYSGLSPICVIIVVWSLIEYKNDKILTNKKKNEPMPLKFMSAFWCDNVVCPLSFAMCL